MEELVEIIEKARKSDEELTLYGSRRKDQIESVCKALEIKLPDSYEKFLELYGGGGWEGHDAWLSGIPEGDPLNNARGYIYGDNLRCRELYGLPPSLVVIYNDFDDEIICCLDTTSFNEVNECKLVYFSTRSNQVDGKAEDNFLAFAKEYFEPFPEE